MRTIRLLYFRSLCIALFATICFSHFVDCPIPYHELYAGLVTLFGMSKTQDLLAPFVFILTYLTSIKLLDGPSHREADSTPLSQKQIYFYLSAIGISFIISKLHWDRSLWALFLPTLLAYIAAYRGHHKTQWNQWYLFVRITFIGILPIGPSLALLKYYPIETPQLLGFTLASLGLLSSATIFTALLKYKPELLTTFLNKGSQVSQYCCSLFIFCVLPTSIQTSTETLSYGSTLNTSWFLLTAILCCLYLSSQFRKRPDHISSLSVFFVLTIIKHGATHLPVISADDYHFGEKLLGWWTYSQHDMLPYIDYIPPHGILHNYIPGWFASLLYSGPLFSIHEGQRISTILVLTFFYYSLYRATNSKRLALIGSFFAAYDSLILAISLFLFFAKSLRDNHLSQWALPIVAPFVFLLAPIQVSGTLLALVTPLLYRLYQDFRRQPFMALTKGTCFLFLLLASIAPIYKILLGSFDFILVNGSSNHIAWGIPWFHEIYKKKPLFFVYEFIRNSWFLVPCITGTILLYYRKQVRKKDILSWLIPAAILVVCYTPYTMGRIDTNVPSRTGFVSLISWCALIPVMVWPLLYRQQKIRLLYALIFFGVSLSPTAPTATSLNHILTGQLKSADLIDGQILGLPNLKKFISYGYDIQTLTHLKQLRSTTFIDLSSRNALYFYLDHKPPLPVSAAMNLVPMKLQLKYQQLLENNPPQHALISAKNIRESGLSLGLRSYHLYKFVIRNYSPRSIGAITYAMYSPDSPPKYMDIEKFSLAFSPSHLRQLPGSWGKSLGELTNSIESAMQLSPVKIESTWSFLSEPTTPPSLLFLEVKCTNSGKTEVEIVWTGSIGNNGKALATLTNGPNLIPLDTFPSWLLSPQIQELKLNLLPPKNCSQFSIKNASFYTRKRGNYDY